ncbi:hypothetical protein SLS60_007075 [Paraconiothyrium brasiliense]|uniref:Protein NO VEIN C-terminal domain-containing protein n=1 Tax=Paraconiothyrium brasiliense TaxID=300254 RepID=A0ABR3R9P6_9PLEO
MSDEELTLVERYKNALEDLGDRQPATEFEAQAILDSIRVGKGYLDEKTLKAVQAMDTDSRQKVTRLVKNGQETEAAISEQLYSSRYRFLYELIQNADDADYLDAKASKKYPFIRFTASRHTLIIETNEDGFKRDNIEAICATGKSSKKATSSDNHIGEKGFGFKSVFSVAHQVHVQSGLWSFQFKHKPEENGLGMVTPLEATREVLPSDVVTRITLRLSDSTVSGYQGLLDAVDQIPETTILHLHNLRTIIFTKISLDSLSRTRIHRCRPVSDSSGRTMRIQVRTVSSEQVVVTRESTFYAFSRKVENMPQDTRRPKKPSATVELAFPVHTETHKPAISASGQHVFAYLPLYQLPVQFIIQSDFITSASRESLRDCAWNETLRTGVAGAFCDAVATFATKSHPLRHLWLQYLPKEEMRNNFWSQLFPSIKSRLQNMPVWQTWEGGIFKLPSQVCRLVDIFLHEGEPIFSDLPHEVYLAKEYSRALGGLPAILGVPAISWPEILSRIEADIVSPVSRLRTHAADDPWHHACAQLISNALKNSSSTTILRFKKLAIIPVNKGKSWTGAPGVSPGGLNKIYFPTTEDIEIPTNIGLHLVDVAAASIPQRKELYRMLGVQECPTDEVLSKIQAKQTTLYSMFSAEDLSTEIRYLFYFHPHPASLKSWLRIPVGESKAVVTNCWPLYFLSTERYHTQNLLPTSYAENDQTNEVANFVYKGLFDLESLHAYSQVHDHLWRDWLQLVTGAVYYPVLLQPGGTSNPEISKTMLAVLEHSPEEFVGLLGFHWNEYKTEIHLVIEHLKSLEVPCMFPPSSENFNQLQECYLPTTDILSKLQSLEAEQCVPVVKLPEPWSQETRLQWEFLSELGVRSKADLDFYITIHVHEDWFGGSENPEEALIELYTGLAGLATASDFDHLRQLYGHVPHLETFFKMALGLSDYTLDDIIEELKFKSTNEDRPPKVQWEEIYQWLNDNVRGDEDWDRVRNAFIEDDLVWGPDGEMHALRNCLWLSPFPLAEYVDLSQVYPDLEDFFVKRLHVERAVPSMLVDEIKKMATKRSPQVENIRQRLIDIGRLVVNSGIDDTLSKALAGLAKVKFLPKTVDNGSKTLVGKDDDFAINDHERFGDALNTQNVLLDFSVDEVRILSTMFGYMGLSNKYLSQMVSEESVVGEGAIEHPTLSRAFKSRAYALYCCAARYKSTKALRGDVELYDQLSNAQVYVTDSINTDLVLNFKTGPIRVHSDRLAVHHELCSAQLNFYVPKDERQQKSCYRSQLPKLLASIMGVDLNATQAILQILTCTLLELDDILSEQDITTVDWIPKPTYRAPASPVLGTSRTVAPRDAPNDDLPALEFDHEETFGSRNADERAHDSRIGASGEAYVFETLSALDLPGFSKENWRSNMRRELLAQPRYVNLGSWNGRETADFVYTDRDGSLTRYLREHCVGSMPHGIARNHDFSQHPIEYFLEVKSTTSGCNTRFYMSGSQFERMQKCAVPVFTPPEKVYVILRVFNLGPNTDMKIFVDPKPRGSGTNYIKFEVGTYHCTTRDTP